MAASEDEFSNIETEVFQLLPLVNDIQFLLQVCEKCSVKIDDANQGNKHIIIKTLLKFLNGSDEINTLEDQGVSVVLQLHNDLKDHLKIDIKTEIGHEHEPDVSKMDENNEENPKESKLHFHRLRDFKIHGSVGGPDQKDKLSYVSLSYQISNAKSEGRSGAEICAAVIKAITPGSSLRNYLESTGTTNVNSLIQVLRAHFKEKDSSTAFNEMSNCVQGPAESELDFCLRAMSLRQKVVMLAEEEGCPYDSKLLRKRFFHAIFTGFKHNNIRLELQSVLKQGIISDEDLLREVSLTVANELEHSLKTKAKSTGAVNEIHHVDSEKPAAKKKENPLLTEINRLSAQVNELAGLKKEISDLKKEFKSLEKTCQNPTAAQFCPKQNQQGNQQYSNKRDFRCISCKETKQNYCNHCFQCGQTDHKRNECPKK